MSMIFILSAGTVASGTPVRAEPFPAARPGSEQAQPSAVPDGYTFKPGEFGEARRLASPDGRSAARRPRDRPAVNSSDGNSAVSQPRPVTKPRAAATAPAPAQYGRVPPHFIRNEGQLDPEVLYYMKGSRGTVYLTAEEVVFDFVSGQPATPDRDLHTGGDPRPATEPDTVSRLVFRLRFRDTAPDASVEGEEELPGKINYFIGPRENWRTGIPTYRKVSYLGLYPGIDLSIRIREGGLAFRFIADPGSDPGRIALDYSGVEALEINSAGDLIVLTEFGGFRTPAPRLHQKIDGEPAKIDGAFVTLDDLSVALKLAPYDRDFPLIIDF